MVINNIYKTIETNELNDLTNSKCYYILGNINVYIQDTGTWK